MGFPKRISDLPNAGSLKNSDIFVLVNENDVTSQTTLGTIAGMISGGSSTFTGNTLATCIDQLWVHSISGCSPIQLGEIVVNGETTFKGNINLSPDTETDIDFDNANTVSIPTYVLIDCKDSNNKIVTFQNFSEYVGQVVTLASEGPTRWEVTLQPTFEVTSIEECCFDNLKVTNCVSGEVWNIVNYEAWPPGTGFIGSIIKIDGEEGCFSVTGTCEEWTYDAKVIVSDEYDTCGECTGTTYTIFPCDGWDGVPINTDTDLSAYVGGLLAIKEEETGICYTVFECEEDCEPTIPISYEPVLDECDNCKDNWELTNCTTGALLGITTTQAGWLPPPAVYTASTVAGCFTAAKVKEPATIGEVLDVGSLVNCESWPCFNFALVNCEGDILGITDQNLNDFDGLQMSGSNSTHSFSGECFNIEVTPEGPATLGPLDTSDWVEITCGEWPCTNFMVLPCTDGVESITVSQDLSDYVFDVSGVVTGTTFEESLCFTVETTYDSPTVPPVDISSWGSLGIEIDNCAEDPPCQE